MSYCHTNVSIISIIFDILGISCTIAVVSQGGAKQTVGTWNIGHDGMWSFNKDMTYIP